MVLQFMEIAQSVIVQEAYVVKWFILDGLAFQDL